MRVYRGLLILAALVATPFVVGAAQGPAQKCSDKAHPDNRGAVQSASAPGQQKKVCEAPPPPAPPPPAPVPPPAPSCGNGVVNQGTASINGGVFTDRWAAPLAGWCVELTGPVSASALTDASGSYAFIGLPDGMYTVCQVLQSGWSQTFPTDGAVCLSGPGYSFSMVQGSTAWFNDFTNRPVPQ
jgi:hypothetical protein